MEARSSPQTLHRLSVAGYIGNSVGRLRSAGGPPGYGCERSGVCTTPEGQTVLTSSALARLLVTSASLSQGRQPFPSRYFFSLTLLLKGNAYFQELKTRTRHEPQMVFVLRFTLYTHKRKYLIIQNILSHPSFYSLIPTK